MRAPVLLGLAATALAVIPIAAGGPIRCGIEMRNVDLRVAEGVVLHVRALDGEFVSRSANAPPVFDDPSSYNVRLRSAEISVDAASLTSLLRGALSARPSPL